MINEMFCLLSEEERSTKLKAVLKSKTAECLTAEEIQNILMKVSLNRQYRVSVYYEKSSFRCAMTAEDGLQNWLVFPQISHGDENGEVFGEDKVIAVITQNQSGEDDANLISIFIPKSRIQKGEDNER